MELKCDACGGVFGKDITPLLVTTAYLTRITPIVGIQARMSLGIQWELDYQSEDTDEGDIIDSEYQCSGCGANFSEDYIALLFEEEK